MKFGRVKNYPWYQDTVSLICLLSVLWSVWSHYSDLPDTLAVHFDWKGVPNGYSSKAVTLALILGLLFLEWGIDIAIRYQFLLAESSRKRFNWIQLFSVSGVIIVAGCWHQIVDFNLNGGPFELNWRGFLSWFATASTYLFLTEKLRPRGESDGRPISNLGEELATQLPERFCLIDHLAPRWWVHLMLWPGLLMIGGGIAMIFVPSLLVVSSGVATVLGGFLTLLFAGGFRFVLHQKGLEVQFGTLSIPIKHIAKEEIESIELKEFNALADFGGWGLRWGPDNTTAYVLSGQVGLLVRTARRNYLIGSSQSKAFYSALEQLLSRPGGSP
jgi:uncharacterized protein DUF1648